MKIPENYGRWRRWFYNRFPLRDPCPVTDWRHKDRYIGDDEVECMNCGRREYVEYGR